MKISPQNDNFQGKSAKYVIFPSKLQNMLFFQKLKKYVKKYVLCKSHKNPGPDESHLLNHTYVQHSYMYRQTMMISVEFKEFSFL